MEKIKIIILAGPTASGKTETAIRLAQRLNGEIVSADSMQIYKNMDIGSAKPTEEERAGAKHFLVDEIDPEVPFSAADYRRLAGEYIHRIAEEEKVPIVEGGTGLYINSVIYDMDFGRIPANPERREELKKMAEEEGAEALYEMLRSLDPLAAERIHPNNTIRVIRAIEAAESGSPIPSFENSFRPSSEFEPLMFCINRDREQLYDRINRRVDRMLEDGLLEEVQALVDKGLDSDFISMKGIGYKEMIGYINGEYDLNTAADMIRQGTRRFAKRQLTWFRRYPDMIWYDITDGSDEAIDDMCERAERFLSGKQ